MRYALVTPAYNEAERIGYTLASMAAQQRPPERWVVVSDGSTDGTDELVRSWLPRLSFLRFVRREKTEDAGFWSKSRAFEHGRRELEGLGFDLLGNLDADVSFAPDYFARLVEAFRAGPELGLAGGQIYELREGRRTRQDVARNSVAGAVQLFRREVFQAIGGYAVLRQGGEDSLAEIQVRMAGWGVQTLRELEVDHHGPVTTGRRGMLGHRFLKGMLAYRLGYDPSFHFLSCAYRTLERPWVIGGVCMAAGFLWAGLRRAERWAPPEVRRFLRKEQRVRLRTALSSGRLGRA